MTTTKTTPSVRIGLSLTELKELEDLEGSCHALWLLNGGETQEWNGDSCKCEYIQGNFVCKRMKYYDGI